MFLLVLLTVIAVSVVQSIFGVGVLLFGTPLLLLLGFQFLDALHVLLPISIAINLMQIVKHHAHIDLSFYKQILFYSVPAIVICLLLVTWIQIHITAIVGLFLVFVAMKDWLPAVEKWLDRLMAREKYFFITMGAVHGLTNLGGALLTAAVHRKAFPKDVTRVTIATSYLTFATFQLLTLHLAGHLLLSPMYLFLVLCAVAAFVFSERKLYARLEAEQYRAAFAWFLLACGLFLIGKTF